MTCRRVSSLDCFDNELIKIGKETYFRAGDGNLMPTRPGPAAARPDLFQANGEVTVSP
jgi:hypothetical protein